MPLEPPQRRPLLLKRLCLRFMPKDGRWYSIVKSFLLVGFLVAPALYVIGENQPAITRIVLVIWNVSVFEPFLPSTPYMCNTYDICDVKELLSGVEQVSGHPFLYVPFVTGFLISLRLICLCIESLDKSLGVQLIPRLLDKFLPAKSSLKTPEGDNNE